ncbi:hypothetical protein BCEP4_2000008 [Burkholderia cepacia]|nr:hypothetical protein BCEP4_2000008 [Burkholderia cepacia]
MTAPSYSALNCTFIQYFPCIMILPPFDPPQFDAMSHWWRTCTYADVHRLILEVLHLRLTLREMGTLTGDATRMIGYLDRADELQYAAPLRRLSVSDPLSASTQRLAERGA